MDVYSGIGLFLVGLVCGLFIAKYVKNLRTKTGKEILEEALKDIDKNFGDLSIEALTKVSDHLVNTATLKFSAVKESAASDLDSKKELIGKELANITKELEKVSEAATNYNTATQTKFGEVTSALSNVEKETRSLRSSTSSLREALANPKVRGQWGERMAEDVLKVMGFKEGINYNKQETIEGTTSRVDFSFILPKNKRLHMDAKFPLINYMKYLETNSESDKEVYRLAFLKDVRDRMKEVTTRGYIEANQDALEYVLLFIPNESVFAFINEQDNSFIDDCLKNKVICCSPVTLFAILAIVRQAVENFSLEKTTNEILSLLGSFKSQWDLFLKKMDQLGKRLSDAQSEYESLTTTRKRKLEKPLNKIEELRESQGIAIYQDEDSDVIEIANRTISEPLEMGRFLKDASDNREDLN